eukprot:COSAG01_NODE_2764_length_7112_cov_593.144018_3_plen_136_part_00
MARVSCHDTKLRTGRPAQGEFSEGAARPNRTSTAGWVSFTPPCPWDCSGQPDCPNPGTANRYHDTQQNYQGCSGDWRGGMVVDTVRIPASLAPGQYVLGAMSPLLSSPPLLPVSGLSAGRAHTLTALDGVDAHGR